MAGSRVLCLVLVVGLLGEAFTVPVVPRRTKRGFADNELDSSERKGAEDLIQAGSDNRPVRQDGDSTAAPSDNAEGESRSETSTSKSELATPVFDDSDEDDDFEPMNTAPSGGGSNIFSLLRLANAIFPSSSSGTNAFLRRMIRRYLNNQLTANVPIFPPNYPPPLNPTPLFLRRQDVSENKINIDEIKGLKPPAFQRQETVEDEDETDESSDESDENNAAESVEDNNGGNGNDNGNASKQKSGSEEKASENDSDYSDEPPEGDGQGGGILGIIAGLSGGEDGQSDLGSLLATISGIVANLSGGDGFDLNSLIGSGIGLFVGLLSEGEENPGAVIASYLLTSLETITGGGSKNNGAFFGTFLSKLIRGTSAGGDPDASSEEGKEPEKDSAGFFGSFLMAVLGEMSKGSLGGSSSCSHCHPSERSANTTQED